MNVGLLLPLSLLASLAFLLNRFNVPPAEVDEDVFLREGYGFAGVAVFVTVVCVSTLLVLNHIS